MAANAREALDLLDASPQPVDLLLCDVVIPGTPGVELARLVQARSPSTRVLFMSGYTSNAIIHHGELEEGVSLLQKPFSRAQLAARIRQVLDAWADVVPQPSSIAPSQLSSSPLTQTLAA